MLTRSLQGIQQLKDNDYSARFIFLAPPNPEELEQRLVKRGTDSEDKIKERLEIAKAELAQSEVEGFHNQIFINDDLEATYKSLEAYIFGDEEAEVQVEAPEDTADTADTTAMETDDIKN